MSWPERWMGTTSACWGWPPASRPGAARSSSLTTSGRSAARAELSGSSSILRIPPFARAVRLYDASRCISALPVLTRYIAPATAPMSRPAWVSATLSTSSSARDELTAEAMASKSAARSRAPLSSASAASSSRVVPRIRMSERVRRMNAMISRTEGTSSTAARSKVKPPLGARCHRLTPGKSGWFYTRPELEPLSFDDLPLGGEWTTRRRTVSEADIALFAGVAGDLSPLTIEANAGSPRHAPPALVVAIAVGLGSVDTPVPSVAEWEWLNWKFPREVRAGDTIYARWTLTQHTPPVAGAPSSIVGLRGGVPLSAREACAPASIVVWRVDVHLLDGALCAEGEVGAKVNRKSRQPVAAPKPAAPPAASGAAAAPRRRRRRPRANGGVLAGPASVAAPPPAAAKPERTSSPSRRRRRRRSGAGRGDEEHEPRAPHVQETTPAPPVVAAAAPLSTATKPGQQGTIGKVLRRLRGST